MSDTMSIDDNTRVYDEKDAPMTELSPRTQRLLEAIDLMNLEDGVGDTAKMVTVPSYILSKIRAARAAFEPEMVLISYDLVKFLSGEAPLHGVWFGETETIPVLSTFWWRKHLPHPNRKTKP